MTLATHTAAAGAYRALAPIVLASNSPRRRDLLGSLGLDFEVCPSNAPEPPPAPGEAPEDYARRMANMKTMDVAVLYPESVVLGADTIVVLPGPGKGTGGATVLGKPKSDADALAMLTSLSGCAHKVITGCCLVVPGAVAPWTMAVATEVTMRASTTAELTAYIATGEPHDKAGAYAIQGLGAFLVTQVRGSYTNVVGLPVAEIAEMLLQNGAMAAR